MGRFREKPVVLGDYFTPWHITNVWNSVVLEGRNPREALEKAVEDINRELIQQYATEPSTTTTTGRFQKKKRAPRFAGRRCLRAPRRSGRTVSSPPWRRCRRRPTWYPSAASICRTWVTSAVIVEATAAVPVLGLGAEEHPVVGQGDRTRPPAAALAKMDGRSWWRWPGVRPRRPGRVCPG